MSLGFEVSIDGETGEVYVGPARPVIREHKGRSLMAFPGSYVAIDLETTGLDPRYEEIIEVAGIKYENGHETGRFESLVNPHRKIGSYITELTGITDEMLITAPDAGEVLPEFFAFIGGLPVVGHNVNFDVNFLYDGSPKERPFSNDFIDTLRLSRRLYHDLPNHKLPTLVDYLGVADQVEHRALADCLAAQACFQKMKEEADRLGGLPEPSWKHFGSLSKTITPRTTEFNMDSPVFGMSFAFTGKLERMTRKEAMQAVADAGGILCDEVVASTNYLVLGDNDYCKAIKGGKSNKQKKAEKMRLAGSDIAVISEDLFYDMLETGKRKSEC